MKRASKREKRRAKTPLIREKYVNTYHNASTPPKPTERPEMVAFYNAAERILN
jgi:hypothetical protein